MHSSGRKTVFHVDRRRVWKYLWEAKEACPTRDRPDPRKMFIYQGRNHDCKTQALICVPRSLFGPVSWSSPFGTISTCFRTVRPWLTWKMPRAGLWREKPCTTPARRKNARLWTKGSSARFIATSTCPAPYVTWRSEAHKPGFDWRGCAQRLSRDTLTRSITSTSLGTAEYNSGDDWLVLLWSLNAARLTMFFCFWLWQGTKV